MCFVIIYFVLLPFYLVDYICLLILIGFPLAFISQIEGFEFLYENKIGFGCLIHTLALSLTPFYLFDITLTLSFSQYKSSLCIENAMKIPNYKVKSDEQGQRPD